MSRLHRWSVRHARSLNAVYQLLESVLSALHPLWQLLGYRRVDPFFAAIEKPVKTLLFDSRSCGQCILGSTGLSCPMNCPKSMRNGPCGGVRADGSCEVEPGMQCVWVAAWEGSQRMRSGAQAIQVLQAPVDHRLQGSSAWMRAVRARRQLETGPIDAL